MNNFEENPLRGDRPEDREQTPLEDVDAKGSPLWMAFLADPEALSINGDEVRIAKNEYEDMKSKHPEVIKMCAQKPDECKTIIQSVKGNRAA